jgi:hypothetical protein
LEAQTSRDNQDNPFQPAGSQLETQVTVFEYKQSVPLNDTIISSETASKSGSSEKEEVEHVASHGSNKEVAGFMRNISNAKPTKHSRLDGAAHMPNLSFMNASSTSTPFSKAFEPFPSPSHNPNTYFDENESASQTRSLLLSYQLNNDRTLSTSSRQTVSPKKGASVGRMPVLADVAIISEKTIQKQNHPTSLMGADFTKKKPLTSGPEPPQSSTMLSLLNSVDNSKEPVKKHGSKRAATTQAIGERSKRISTRSLTTNTITSTDSQLNKNLTPMSSITSRLLGSRITNRPSTTYSNAANARGRKSMQAKYEEKFTKELGKK